MQDQALRNTLFFSPFHQFASRVVLHAPHKEIERAIQAQGKFHHEVELSLARLVLLRNFIKPIFQASGTCGAMLV